MRETFDPAWLALREAADHRARARALLPPLGRWWSERGASEVLDLGSGTGSNLRYLAPRLPAGHQSWTLVDHDADLLGRVRAPDAAVEVRKLEGDLADAALAEVGSAHLVTASALLDLVSERWLRELASACSARGAAALFALSYEGTIEWVADDDPADALVRSAVNEHQRRDKGMGAALGPAAASVAEALFRERGYRTWLAPSAWSLDGREADLARALVGGWAAAALEQRPADRQAAEAWAERRRATVARGDFTLVVGHQDLLALPVDTRAGRS